MDRDYAESQEESRQPSKPTVTITGVAGRPGGKKHLVLQAKILGQDHKLLLSLNECLRYIESSLEVEGSDPEGLDEIFGKSSTGPDSDQ